MVGRGCVNTDKKYVFHYSTKWYNFKSRQLKYFLLNHLKEEGAQGTTDTELHHTTHLFHNAPLYHQACCSTVPALLSLQRGWLPVVKVSIES